jgi:hypothetical protein
MLAIAYACHAIEIIYEYDFAYERRAAVHEPMFTSVQRASSREVTSRMRRRSGRSAQTCPESG